MATVTRYAGYRKGLFSLMLAFSWACYSTALAADWKLVHKETFDGSTQLKDKVPFGDQGWLTPRLRGGGTIALKDGLARFETTDFRASALLQITRSLPAEYKIRVKLGRIKYDIGNYSDSDFTAKGFKYNRRYLENGFYWLALTDRTVEETSGEDWWHRYRKVVIDSDDHLEERYPVYMVYMNPVLDRSSGNWIGGMSELLRCWSKGKWFAGKEEWVSAFHYTEKDWYVVELEKYTDRLVMRVLTADGKVIQETKPVSLDLIYGMGKKASKHEYAYVGEPHVDSYKGDAFVDEIQLFLPSGQSANYDKRKK